MNEWLALGLGLIVGCGLGGTVLALMMAGKRGRVEAELEGARARGLMLEEQGKEAVEEVRMVREQMDGVNWERERAEKTNVELQERLVGQQKQFEEQAKLMDEVEKRFLDAFGNLSLTALRENSKQFEKSALEKLGPIKELLEKHGVAIGEIEKKREGAYGKIEEQIKLIAASHEKLNTETHRLVTALRRPEQRGRWGELQLRNVVELAGMTAHCDFDEQVTVWSGEAAQRPDMVVKMPGEGVIVVDSKVALDAYLDMLQPDADKEACLKRHAKQVESHFRGLARKEYWNRFERTPKIVVMFMPLEPALSAALEVKPDLHAEAMRNHVLIATPTLLVALLRAVAYGWQQESVSANAREIAEVGRELYDRVEVFVGHFGKVGKALKSGHEAYNRAVGSLDSRVLTSAKKLRELDATTEKEIEAPDVLEIEVREVKGLGEGVAGQEG